MSRSPSRVSVTTRRRRVRFVPAAAVTFGAVALCGLAGVAAAPADMVGAVSETSDPPTTTERPEIRPFEDVQASEFVFEADPADPARGIFRVRTTEPMICAIVWGETEAFGIFNNSLAMSGTGIVDHDVFLPGAVPGRTYYFRVQGVTADGTFFASDTGTFVIPEDADVDNGDAPAGTFPHGPNLALDGSVTDVSSEFGDAFAAANAIDDSGTTEWSSDGDGDDASITIDLGDTHDVAGVEFVTRSMADGSAIAETFSVTVDDGETFGPFAAATPSAPAIAAVETTGRRFRFDVETSTGGNVGAVEVRVFAP